MQEKEKGRRITSQEAKRNNAVKSTKSITTNPSLSITTSGGGGISALAAAASQAQAAAKRPAKTGESCWNGWLIGVYPSALFWCFPWNLSAHFSRILGHIVDTFVGRRIILKGFSGCLRRRNVLEGFVTFSDSLLGVCDDYIKRCAALSWLSSTEVV